jgi:hypothetical protein
MNRHYLRCTYCERPMSVEVLEREELKFILEQACPLCGEKALRYMGQVHKTDIVRQGVKAACDMRCTNAVGPKCDCVCVNVNHGTKKLVVFNKIVGKLEVVQKDLLNNNEAYLARIKRMAAAKNFIKVNVITFLNWKNKEVLDLAKSLGGYWRLGYGDYNKYSVYQQMLKQIDKIEDLKSIQRKINSLTGLIKQIGNNLEYLEAIFDKKQEVKV